MSKISLNSVLKLKLENGTDASGNTAYTVKSWKDINAGVSDDDLLDFGSSLAGLQTATLSDVLRVDTESLS